MPKVPCEACNGTGGTFTSPCRLCEGEKTRWVWRKPRRGLLKKKVRSKHRKQK